MNFIFFRFESTVYEAKVQSHDLLTKIPAMYLNNGNSLIFVLTVACEG